MLIQHWTRFLENLIGRLHGPMGFRLIIQPIVAASMAVRDGLKDAKAVKPSYFMWSLVTEPARRRELLREALQAVLKVFIAAIVIDAIYQWKVARCFYPGEALVVAVVLALIPYTLVRGPAHRLRRLFLQRSGTNPN